MKLKTYGPAEFLESRLLESGNTELEGISLTNVTVCANGVRDYYGVVDPTVPEETQEWAPWKEFKEDPNSVCFLSVLDGVNELLVRRGEKLDMVLQIPSIIASSVRELIPQAQANLREYAKWLEMEPGTISISFGYAILKWEDVPSEGDS